MPKARTRTMTKDLQSMYARYKRETGETEVDLADVAVWAFARGFTLPTPPTDQERLAQMFARALRQEVRHDATSGRPYRANHAYPRGVMKNGQGTLWSWIDIDQAAREPMRKSLQHRREQMVGDGLQLTLDAEHWSRFNPTEQALTVEMDFTDDIEWRLNAPDERAG